MAVYQERNDSIFVKEHYMYGSSRLGSIHEWIFVSSLTPHTDTNRFARVLGKKNYELGNHLGNVLTTISDQKKAIEDGTTGTIAHWTADVVSYSDYYPFGMMMAGRSGNASGYRYGFQAQETDAEVYGPGNAVSYKYRIHDARIGRFFSVDPLYREYPWNSTYAFSENRLIDGIELEGLEYKKVTLEIGSHDDGELYVQKASVEIDQNITFKSENGAEFAKTDVYIKYKEIEFEEIVKTIIEPTTEESGGLIPSASYDYTESEIDGKRDSDINYIIYGERGNFLSRIVDVFERDRMAPENNAWNEVVDLLDINTSRP